MHGLMKGVLIVLTCYYFCKIIIDKLSGPTLLEHSELSIEIEMTLINEKYSEKKHFLIIGKSKSYRRKYVEEIISRSNRVIYRFNRNLSSFDDYIEQVRSIFPFIPNNWGEHEVLVCFALWDYLHLAFNCHVCGTLGIFDGLC